LGATRRVRRAMRNAVIAAVRESMHARAARRLALSCGSCWVSRATPWQLERAILRALRMP